jgi:coenzyme F420-reducing hydrogenase delta subunit
MVLCDCGYCKYPNVNFKCPQRLDFIAETEMLIEIKGKRYQLLHAPFGNEKIGLPPLQK